MKTFLLILLFILGCYSLNAQKISYAYDSAGNMVKREVVLTTPQKVSPQASLEEQVFFDEVEHLSFKIKSLTDFVDIEVINFQDGYEGQVALFGINGTVLYQQSISASVIHVDLSKHPKGIYLLRVSVNKESTTWKINKK